MSLMDEYNKALAQLKADVNDIVHNDMRDGIRVAMIDSANKDVYSYKPKVYERRWTLTDPSHYEFNNIEMGIEVISNIQGNPAYAPPASSGWNPGFIGNIIQTGNGYPWFRKGSDMDAIGPRPWLDDGMKNYVESGEANSDLAESLRARGYIVV